MDVRTAALPPDDKVVYPGPVVGVQRQLKRDQAVSSGATGACRRRARKEAGRGQEAEQTPNFRASAGACVGETAQIPEKGPQAHPARKYPAPAWGGPAGGATAQDMALGLPSSL